jgi:hypothetical protein
MPAAEHDHSHDEYCPKSHPTRTYDDPEAGDRWEFGPAKFRCFCVQIREARAVAGVGDVLRLAYARGLVDADNSNPSTGATPSLS